MTTTRKPTAKAKRRRVGKTPDQRAAEAQALHETLTAQVEELVSSGAWRAYLDFMASFHDYSFTNLMLILAQRPDASLVAGFRQWQAKGRQVRKGEKAIKIRGFSSKKVTEEDPETGDETEKVLRRFPILSVFDIAQTDPIDGADVPEQPAHRLTGEDPDGIYQAMAEHMTAKGWTITRKPIAGETNGFTTTDGTKQIVVEETLAPAMAAKTMLHEAAHATLHVDEGGKSAKDVDYIAHRGICECEAESVAYVLAGMAGLDTSEYSVGYVAGWTGGDLDAVRSCAENVLRAVQILAFALVEDEPPAEDHNEHHTTAA